MNHPDLRLGYLVLGTRKPAAWTDFCRHMLGLPDPVMNADGSQGWQIDDASQRLVIQPDGEEDLVAIGLDCGDDAGLAGVLRNLREQGMAAEAAPADLRQARRVRQLHRLHDPAGNTVELFCGLEPASRPFASAAFPGGFVTGSLGMGHAVLVHRDLQAMEDFYGALGFRVSQRMESKAGGIPFRGNFLFCNPRHHTIGLFALPWRRRLHHFMLQAADPVDVARACERARSLKVPLSLTLGQHPDDDTFSFYGRTPSGFDFEVGAGGRPIDPVSQQPEHATVPSSWGHEPQLSLKLRVAGALLTRRMGA